MKVGIGMGTVSSGLLIPDALYHNRDFPIVQNGEYVKYYDCGDYQSYKLLLSVMIAVGLAYFIVGQNTIYKSQKHNLITYFPTTQ